MTLPPLTDRKPRLALLGEFSAGKSTLANALLGQTSSPVRVTATQVPPLWYTLGDGAPIRVARDGSETALDTTDLGALPVADTRVVRVPLIADILETVDLLDMPGSSDPNMDPDIWDALLPEADLVIWCTPASQAWRQSEAAIWEECPEILHDRSLLLLTRIDKVAAEQDRARVRQRVARETEGLFHSVLPVSLLEALGAQGDADAWRRSGLEAVMAALTEIVMRIHNPVQEDPGEAAAALRRARADGATFPAAVAPEPVPERAAAADTAAPRSTGGIMPRRVTAHARGGARRTRPGGGDTSPLL